MTSATTVELAQSQTLARVVRELRLSRDWSIDQLVARSNVSKGAIVALEHGAGNPNLSTLVRLATAFEVSVSALLGEDEAEAVRIVEHAAVDPLWVGPGGGTARLLFTVPGSTPVELWLWTLLAGEWYVSHPHPRFVLETLTVQTGLLHLTLAGERIAIPAGATATFQADREHTYAALAQETTFLMTVHLRASHGAGPAPP